MKKRMTALLLALVMLFASGASAVSAEDESAGAAEPAAEAGTGSAPRSDAAGALSFEDLGERMLESYYPLLSLEGYVAAIEAIDYDKMESDLRDGLNQIADLQWLNRMNPQPDSYTAALLQQRYDAAREQFDAIRSGEMQADNAGRVRQLRSAEDQVLMLGETLYISLCMLEESDAALTRNLAALDRGLAALKVSHENGLVSELSLRQAENGRVQLASGQQTLQMNYETNLLQLKAMVGAEPDAPLALAALPRVTEEELAAMDLSADLARAKEASYELYAAKQTLDDAKESYDDAVEEYGSESTRYEFSSAKYQWQAARYDYEGTVQNFELKFRALYAQIGDYAQALDAAKSALALEERNYAASALKCEQGTISRNALADAADTLADASDKVSGAERDLFTAYRSYYWAVEHGILN